MHPVANSVRNWRSVSLIWQGRFEEAESLAIQGAQIAENMHGLLLLAACRAAAGFARWKGTGDDNGLRQLRDAIQWMEGRRFQFFVSVQYSWMVEVCVAAGDIGTARAYASYVLRRAREGERLGEAATCRTMARAAGMHDDLIASERWLRRAETSARLRGSRREAALNEVARGQNLARQGLVEASRRTLAEASAVLRALGMHWHAEQAALGLEMPVLLSRC
jgi:hypothetical protein